MLKSSSGNLDPKLLRHSPSKYNTEMEKDHQVDRQQAIKLLEEEFQDSQCVATAFKLVGDRPTVTKLVSRIKAPNINRSCTKSEA